jgi:prolipoprotein diacylglyceryltransferase
MNQEAFKKTARGLFAGIVVVILLAALNINFTDKDKTYADNWKFALSHPTILLHILVATVVLIGSLILLVRSIQSRKKPWIIWSAIGSISLFIAYGYGEVYVKTLANYALSDMGSAGGAALLVYGIMWYLYRKKKDKKETGELKP